MRNLTSILKSSDLPFKFKKRALELFNSIGFEVELEKDVIENEIEVIFNELYTNETFYISLDRNTSKDVLVKEFFKGVIFNPQKF